jgi:TATA-box binding protein (TBP) (component of TFIID and TFIIIB)
MDQIDFFESMDDAWDKFINFGITENTTDEVELKREPVDSNEIPESSPIFISTKTKIIYLNVGIDLKHLFWNLPMINYDSLEEGIIKKEIRFNFVSREEVTEFEENIQKLKDTNIKNLNVVVLNQINNPTGRVTFKDIRKIDIGICKNDLIKNKKKKETKNAFYNSFVIIYRVFTENKYKEFHIKMFNTGKIEIPGIQTEESVDLIMNRLIGLLKPYYTNDIYENERTTILINSNFTCNYYINRDKLFNLLKTKYDFGGNYDPCSYPGILCKYKINSSKKVSFMIFRTGSVLIVGKCNDDDVNEIYQYLKKLFKDEYHEICELNSIVLPKKIKKKVKKTMFLKS